MRLKVIGTGSKGNAYLLENGEEALLIECGVNIKAIKQALGFNLTKLVGCLVTHEHGDHAKSIRELMAYGVDVWATKGTHKACGVIKWHRAKIFAHRCEIRLGGFRILPFTIHHDAAEPCGFIIHHPECGNTLFLTDTIYSPFTFEGLNNIIVEANYCPKIAKRNLGDMEFLRNRIINNHMSIDTCVDLLKANDLSTVNNIVLIHLSDSNSDELKFIEQVQEATGKTCVAAYNGMFMQFNKTPF